MADEAAGRDLEPFAGSRTSDSVHGSQDRHWADLASHSAADRQRCEDGAARLIESTPAGVSGGIESSPGLHTISATEGATLHEIRSETGWQAHTVRGFISRNLSKPGRKVRSFEREGERVYRLKV
jgi:hypothetical protein